VPTVQTKPTWLAPAICGAAVAGIAMTASLVVPRGIAGSADPPSCIAGTWTIDRPHSEFPTDIGFDIPVAGVVDPTRSTTAGRGRGGRTGGSDSGLGVAHETEQTLKITADVTDEAAHPWSTLAITVSDADVAVGDGAAVTRHFRPGKSDEQRLVDGASRRTRSGTRAPSSSTTRSKRIASSGTRTRARRRPVLSGSASVSAITTAATLSPVPTRKRRLRDSSGRNDSPKGIFPG
jgi:hypothetical protein